MAKLDELRFDTTYARLLPAFYSKLAPTPLAAPPPPGAGAGSPLLLVAAGPSLSPKPDRDPAAPSASKRT